MFGSTSFNGRELIYSSYVYPVLYSRTILTENIIPNLILSNLPMKSSVIRGQGPLSPINTSVYSRPPESAYIITGTGVPTPLFPGSYASPCLGTVICRYAQFTVVIVLDR